MHSSFFSAFRFILGPAAFALLTTSVFAQPVDNSLGPWYLRGQPQGWYFDLIGGLEYEPTYAGSDKNELEPEFNARAYYVRSLNQRYFLSLGELGAYFDFNEKWLFGALFEYEPGRDNDDDDTLTGFEEVDDTVELQLSLFRRFGNAYAGIVLQPDVLDRGKGFVYFLGAGYDKTVIPNRFRYSVTTDLSWGDSEHMQTEFGVSPQASAATGLPVFDAEGGLKSWSTAFSAEYYFSAKWSLLGQVELEYYFDNAADSPLIDLEGTRTTMDAGLALRYRF